MTYRHHLLSLSMLFLLAFVAWTTLSFHSQHAEAMPDKTLPDVLMDDVSALIMDKQGKPRMKINAPHMIHFTEHDTTHLIDPELTIFRNSTKPWFITAKFAEATQGTSHVHFWDNVIIQHAADAHSPATLIKTPTLDVHPDNQVAETQDAITLIQPNITVNALGMRTDMGSGDVQLLSQARGEYAQH